MDHEGKSFEKLVLVCVNEKESGACCNPKGSMEIWAALKSYTKEHGISDKVRVSKTHCLGNCANGPTVVIEPENIWYSHVSQEDVPEIIEKHFPKE